MLVAIGWLMVTSWMPRTSPTFQSRLGLSGWVLWQVTQASPITHRRDQPARVAVKQRATRPRSSLVRLAAQRRQRALLEVVQRVRRRGS